MNCTKCKYNANYMCPCSNSYLCNEHLGKHLDNPGVHKFEKLEVLSSQELKSLKMHLIIKVKDLKNQKLYIINEANHLIALTEKCTKLVCDKIDKCISSFIEFTNYNNIYPKLKEALEESMKNFKELNKTGLKLDLSVKESYEIILNELPSNNWTDHKKMRLAEMMLDFKSFSASMKISNDGKMLFSCKI